MRGETLEQAARALVRDAGRGRVTPAAFREALVLQPDLELDSSRTSPTVLRALAEAQSAGPVDEEPEPQPEPEADADAGDEQTP